MRVLGFGASTGAKIDDLEELTLSLNGSFDLIATLDRAHLIPLGHALAELLNVPLRIITATEAELAQGRCLTQSTASAKASGLGSVAEAVALAAAGPNATLEGPRQTGHLVTVAVAHSEI